MDALNPDNEIKAKFQSHTFSLQTENKHAGSAAYNSPHSIKGYEGTEQKKWGGGDREINVLHHMTRSVEGPGTEEDHELGAREITALNSFLINSLSQGQRNRDVA